MMWQIRITPQRHSNTIDSYVRLRLRVVSVSPEAPPTRAGSSAARSFVLSSVGGDSRVVPGPV